MQVAVPVDSVRAHLVGLGPIVVRSTRVKLDAVGDDQGGPPGTLRGKIPIAHQPHDRGALICNGPDAVSQTVLTQEGPDDPRPQDIS